MGKSKEEVVGKLFGRWLVVKKLKMNNRNYYKCECQCDSKTIKNMRLDSLKSNKNLDCGCLNKEDCSLVNRIFGHWKVLELAAPKKNTHLKQWKCICTLCCKKVKNIPETYLLRGVTNSCGCNKNENKLKDLSGKRFGFLTVIKRIGLSGHTPTWLCVCDCGGDRIVPRNDLKRRDGREITHCGCKNMESVNGFIICEDYVVGNTTRGWEFYFDINDLEEVEKYSWCMDDKGYVRSRQFDEKGQRKTIVLHRLLLNAAEGEIVDHKNNTPCDNRRTNIRMASIKENTRNRTPRSPYNISGLSKNDRGKWLAGINVDKKHIYLGTFNTYEEAFEARKDAEIFYFGEFRYQGNES
ncbi:hypothetical protein [Paenibacillus silvae]|uniref:AP2/ERF domain-containing protein n=1 Tax=Paenibacillus silvae TaxID=1325358 RepID=A0A2W6NNR4_9BACL|nr:hypothetical protein [Paenibacillus silvae]PZT57471.1 hypothetical protein DN757_02105 [Paenibacillus silvae]